MEIEEALQVIIATMYHCENMQPKFKEGSAQYTLLKNRIAALRVVISLMRQEENGTLKELKQAQAPIASILQKCTKALSKQEPGSNTHQRLERMIASMKIAQTLIEERIDQK